MIYFNKVYFMLWTAPQQKQKIGTWARDRKTFEKTDF